MSLGPLPYKAKVTSVSPGVSGDSVLQISVLDAGSTVRNQTSYLFPATTLQDSTAVRQLLDAMLDVTVQQFLADAGDFTTALTSVSVAVGG